MSTIFFCQHKMGGGRNCGKTFTARKGKGGRSKCVRHANLDKTAIVRKELQRIWARKKYMAQLVITVEMEASTPDDVRKHVLELLKGSPRLHDYNMESRIKIIEEFTNA